MLFTMSGLSYVMTDAAHSTSSCDCIVQLVANVNILLWLIAQSVHPHAVFSRRAAQVSDHSCSLLFQIRSASPNLQMPRQYEVAATHNVHCSQGEHNSIPALPSFSDTKITGFSVAAAACTATNHQSCQRQVAMPAESPRTLILHHLSNFQPDDADTSVPGTAARREVRC